MSIIRFPKGYSKNGKKLGRPPGSVLVASRKVSVSFRTGRKPINPQVVAIIRSLRTNTGMTLQQIATACSTTAPTVLKYTKHIHNARRWNRSAVMNTRSGKVSRFVA